MANTLKIKRGTNATIPQGQLAEPLFTTDTYDLYIGKGSGGNQRFQKYIASGTSSQFLKGDGTLDSTTYQATSEKGANNGYASLDSGGKVPASQLPNSIMDYLGTWNASTNTPTLADGTGNAGDVYIVSVGGTQNLGSGSITFAAGDWVVYSGSVWQKSINSNAVASVNGQTGVVVLTTTNISEGTNLYYTDTRARAAITLTTTGNSGAATYTSGTLNIPNYTLAGLGGQPQLNGTGFVKATGTTISYDNSTYLSTSGGSISATSAGYALSITNIEDSSQGLLLRSTDADTTLYLARFQSSATAVSTTWIDRFSIAKNGSVVVGDNTPITNVRLYVKGASTSSSNYALNIADTNGADIAWFRDDKAIRFYGDLTGVGASFSGNISAANLSGTNTGDQTLSGLGGVPTTRTLTINGTAYDLSANRTWSVGTIGGSGTANYVSKFTAGSTLGNSLIYDNGTAVMINTTTDNTVEMLQVNGGIRGTSLRVASNFSSGTAVNVLGQIYVDNRSSQGGNRIFLTPNTTSTTPYVHFYEPFTAFNTNGGISIGTSVAITTTPTNSIMHWDANNIRVGINKTNPSTTLDVAGAATFSGALSGTSATFSGLVSAGNSSPSTSYNAGSWFTGDGLVVGTISTVCGIQINSSPTSTLSAIRFGDGDGANNLYDQGFIVYNHNINRMSFGTDRGTRLTIDSTGAATFSSSVTATNYIASGGNNTTVFNSASATTGWVQMAINNTSGSGLLGVEGSTAGTLATGTTAYATILRNYTATDLQIATNNIVRATITSGGNVGIGTSSPDTYSYGGTRKFLTLRATLTNEEPFLQLIANGVGNSLIDFGNATIRRATIIGLDGSHLTFNTNGSNSGSTVTERMRITSGGALLVGQTTSIYPASGRNNIELNGSTAASGGSAIFGLNLGGTAAGYLYADNVDTYLVHARTSGKLVVQNYNAGVYLSYGATSWTANSDERLKNITGNIENAVNSLMTLRTIKHTWKNNDDNKEHLALIAQDVEKVFPELIDKSKLSSKPNEQQTDNTEYLGVRYTELIPVLVKAIQELSAKVTELENKIN